MKFLEALDGAMIMAPMTRGTDLPFRRLLSEMGATIAVGEMAYAHKIVKETKGELPLLRRHPDEKIFGVQLAGKKPELMAEAAIRAEAAGADFVDVNLGCPIHDATKRGFGAALLQRPGRVAQIVEAMKQAVSIPVTVKLRLGWSSEKPTFLKIAKALESAGADAVGLHARSRAQRYRKPADWERVQELVESVSIPVIGNGDIMTWRDAVRRREETGCAATMVGRWALSKPWIFREYANRSDESLDADARIAMIRRYVELCKEHLGDDEWGLRGVRRFLVFHQDFFRRYRRDAGEAAVNSDDDRDWGAPPADEMEAWLCRGDLAAVEALCDWLVDGKPCAPPPPATADARRAAKSEAYG